jgi:hypothetical protein
VGDVEADEGPRHALERQLALQFVDRVGGALVGLHRGELELLEQVRGVRSARSSSWRFEPRCGTSTRGALERLLEHRAVVEVERHEQLARALLRGAEVAAREKAERHVGIGVPVDVLEKR